MTEEMKKKKLKDNNTKTQEQLKLQQHSNEQDLKNYDEHTM